MSSLREAIAYNLSKLLREKKFSQTDLAAKAKTSFQTVNGYAHGRTGISEDMISKFAKVLNVEETDLTAPLVSSNPITLEILELRQKLAKYELHRVQTKQKINDLFLEHSYGGGEYPELERKGLDDDLEIVNKEIEELKHDLDELCAKYPEYAPKIFQSEPGQLNSQQLYEIATFAASEVVKKFKEELLEAVKEIIKEAKDDNHTNKKKALGL